MVISKEDTCFSAISFSQVLISSLSFPGHAPELQPEENVYKRNKNRPISSKFHVKNVFAYILHCRIYKVGSQDHLLQPDLVRLPCCPHFILLSKRSIKSSNIGATCTCVVGQKMSHFNRVVAGAQELHNNPPAGRIFSKNGVQAFPREKRNCP